MSKISFHPRFRELTGRQISRLAIEVQEQRERALVSLRQAAELARGLQSRLASDQSLEPLVAELEGTYRELEALNLKEQPIRAELDSIARRIQCMAATLEVAAQLVAHSGHGCGPARPGLCDGKG